jgi:SAM-dependent methyltransferase
VSAEGVTERNLANYASQWGVAEYTREDGFRPLERELVESYMPPGGRILDLGCGAGRTTIGLARAGYRPVAIDLVDELLAEARRRYPDLDFRHMDATRLEFDDGSFDGALFSYNGLDCIYPLEARRQCLAEVFRVLKPGGTFILSGHNYLGAIFSGGFFYLRGYVNALGQLGLQIGNRDLLSGYVRYLDGGGLQLLYASVPGRTMSQLRAAGFEGLDLRGVNGERDHRRITWHQQHVHFVARKPRA